MKNTAIGVKASALVLLLVGCNILHAATTEAHSAAATTALTKRPGAQTPSSPTPINQPVVVAELSTLTVYDTPPDGPLPGNPKLDPKTRFIRVWGKGTCAFRMNAGDGQILPVNFANQPISNMTWTVVYASAGEYTVSVVPSNTQVDNCKVAPGAKPLQIKVH